MKVTYINKEVREIGSEYLVKKSDGFYEIEKHLFGEYFVRVQLAVTTTHPINGKYRVSILWKKDPSRQGMKLDPVAYAGLLGNFDEDGIVLEAVKQSSLDANLRNLTHLKGNDNYWYALNKSLRTLTETYYDVMGETYDNNKYLLD